MFDAKYAEYMALGYISMAVLLGGLIAWIYWRYRLAQRENRLLDQIEAEARQDRVAASIGAMEEDAQPEDATPGASGMESPMSRRERTLPGT